MYIAEVYLNTTAFVYASIVSIIAQGVDGFQTCTLLT